MAIPGLTQTGRVLRAVMSVPGTKPCATVPTMPQRGMLPAMTSL